MHNCVTMHLHIKGSGLIPKNLPGVENLYHLKNTYHRPIFLKERLLWDKTSKKLMTSILYQVLTYLSQLNIFLVGLEHFSLFVCTFSLIFNRRRLFHASFSFARLFKFLSTLRTET